MKTPTINSRILKLEVLKGTATRTSVNAVESRTTSLESDVATAQSDISTLQTDVSAVEGDISTLQGDVATLTQGIVDAVSTHNASADAHADIRTLVADRALIGHQHARADLPWVTEPGAALLTAASASAQRTALGMTAWAVAPWTDGTTSDIPEGTQLYFTNARADARIAAQKGQAEGLAPLDAGGKVPSANLPDYKAYVDDGLGACTASARAESSLGGLGEVTDANTVWIFPGDSTTEQAGGSGYLFDELTSNYRTSAGRLKNLVATINFGGSGQKLSDWVNGALGPIQTYSTSNLGTSHNDYYGHKSTGSTSLATQIAWRIANCSGRAVVWAPCYGINDCILDASIGNLTQAQITSYLSGLLLTACRTIRAACPADKILLRVPNPMTARPYSSASGFPSPTQYPSFGTDATADAALVEKWNQGIRGAYLAARNTMLGVSVHDKWDLVYGPSSTSKTVSQLPFLSDLVHPGEEGYKQEAHALADVMNPLSPVRVQEMTRRRRWAIDYAAVSGVQPWELFPPFLDGNSDYQCIADTRLSAIGSTYLDLELDKATIERATKKRPVYIQIGNGAAQFFSSYALYTLGTGTRIGSISNSAAMQAVPSLSPVRIYCNATEKRKWGEGLTLTNSERQYFVLPIAAPAGGTFSAHTGTAVSVQVVVDVYRYDSNTKTLLGQVTIPPNGYCAAMSSGNPTAYVDEGAMFEFMISSASVTGKQVFVFFEAL